MSKSIKKKNQKRILIGAPNNEISSSRSSSSIIDDDEIINIKSLVQKILIYSGRPLKPLEPYKIQEEENEESVAMQVVIKKLENIDYNEEEEVVVEELENVDYDEESLVEWDGPALHGDSVDGSNDDDDNGVTILTRVRNFQYKSQ
ncbi:2934_t:CDS:2 [Entrophospora sp. SA101]|nr:2934_t:CDS:2 [Entrophospora sp. SA101]